MTPASTTSLKRIIEFRTNWLALSDDYPQKVVASAIDMNLFNSSTDIGNNETSKPQEDLLAHIFYHRTCYQRFTDQGKLDRALDDELKEENKKQQEIYLKQLV